MANKISITFNDGFNGISKNENGSLLDVASGKWLPYELLFTALASCMYSTFLDCNRKEETGIQRSDYNSRRREN